MGKRAQVSIEYMVITGFAFLLTIPIIAMFYSQSHQMNEDVTSAQADRIASEIVDAANEVYYLGEPSKKTLTVYMPDKVTDVSFDGKTLVFTVSSTAGDYHITKVSAANLTGNVETFSGLHNIVIEAKANDVEIQG